MNAPTRCQSTTWATERRCADDDESLGDWLLDRPVARARDVRYAPDDMPLARDLALVDLVLGVECLRLPRARRNEPLQTHWTRILSQGLDANDEHYENGKARDAWKIVGKAALALTAAYVFVYLMVVAVVYLARVPDAASALLPDAPSAPAPARSGAPIDRLTVARAS
jgi:hypothetical protein